MSELLYKLDSSPPSLAGIAYLSITDKKGKLIFIVHVNASDSVSLEVFDFDEYSDYLGYAVKIAKIIRSAKCADFEAVKATLGNIIQLEAIEAK